MSAVVERGARKVRAQIIGDASSLASSLQLRSVEIAKRQETRDAWELADAIYEDVLDLVPDDVSTSSSFGERGPHTGTIEAQDKVYDAHQKAGTDVGRSYVRQMFATVRVWPPEDRLPELASFVVHSELRGKDFPNRREIIQRLAAEGKAGRTTWVSMRRWKADRKPAQTSTFLDLVEKRLRGSLKAAGKPWHTVADGDRESIAKILRTIAAEVESGDFPGKP